MATTITIITRLATSEKKTKQTTSNLQSAATPFVLLFFFRAYSRWLRYGYSTEPRARRKPPKEGEKRSKGAPLLFFWGAFFSRWHLPKFRLAPTVCTSRHTGRVCRRYATGSFLTDLFGKKTGDLWQSWHVDSTTRRIHERDGEPTKSILPPHGASPGIQSLCSCVCVCVCMYR